MSSTDDHCWKYFEQLQHVLWALILQYMIEVCQSNVLSDAPAAAGD